MYRFILVALSLVVFAETSLASDSFIKTDTEFLAIRDPYRQAEAWAVCSAVYDLYSEILKEDSPNLSLNLNNTARGAKVAIAMSQMGDLFLNQNLEAEEILAKFNTTWATAKMMMDSLPESASAAILGELEMASENQKVVWNQKLEETLAICSDNIKTQQFYIDQWREMMKRGLFK